ncbi:MAG: extracellular solute-binding protein, partial [Acetobacteraceae bacterium]|nr:extracellular solute-binding protein [Acetobacteraceae bacterium]
MLRTSFGLAVGTGLARPYIAKAAATSASVWQQQGFVPNEDGAFRKLIADYEKLSGNKIDYTIMPFMALGQKAISALTNGEVPDVISLDAPDSILPQNAWNDKLVDVSDVIESQKEKLSPTALLSSRFYNSTNKERSYYLVPYKVSGVPF